MSLDIDHRILRRYERELRRIAEHRKSYAERNIKAICEELMKDLQAFIAIEYAGNADDDDRLTFDTLYGKGRYARFLEEAEQHINSFAPEIQTEIQSLVQDTYTEMYGGMVTAVEGAATTGALATELAAVKAVQPEVLKRVVMNPISGLTLPDRLEKNRREIIYNIKQNIGTGLSLGDRYSTIAKRISDSCNFSYTKAIRIVRTESNRVREAGLNDCAREIDAAVRNGSSGLIGVKIWRTMKDERVRPQRRVKTKKGWKTYNYGGPNHMRMEGKIVKTDELFDLGDGVKTTAPGQSGVAGHDINCRCYIEHDWLTAEEYAAAVKKQGDKTVDKSAESGIINYAKANDVFLFEEDDIPTNAEITPKDVLENLESSKIGNETIDYIQKNNIAVYLNYEKQRHDFRGDERNGIINIFMANIKSQKSSAQTVIHEVTHVRYKIGGCQWAEAVCMAQEKKHITGRDTLTFAEKRKIIQLAHEAYPELRWKKGGYANGKRF